MWVGLTPQQCSELLINTKNTNEHQQLFITMEQQKIMQLPPSQQATNGYIHKSSSMPYLNPSCPKIMIFNTLATITLCISSTFTQT